MERLSNSLLCPENKALRIRPGGLVRGHIFNTRRFSLGHLGRTNSFSVDSGNKGFLQPNPNSNPTSSQKINMKRQSNLQLRLTSRCYSAFLTSRDSGQAVSTPSLPCRRHHCPPIGVSCCIGGSSWLIHKQHFSRNAGLISRFNTFG